MKRIDLPKKDTKPSIITSYATKGGVGKSRLAILMANYFAAIGYKVCILDLDSSTHTAMDFYMLESELQFQRTSHNAYQLLSSTDNNIEDYALPSKRENVYIVPPCNSLPSLRSVPVNTLKDILNKPCPFDYIIIDCSPSYDNFSIAAMKAANTILTAALQDQDSVGTCESLRAYIVREIPEKADDWFIIINGFDTRWKDAITGRQHDYIESYKEKFGGQLTPQDNWLPWVADMNRIRDTGCKLSKTPGISDSVCNEKLYDSIKNICSNFVDDDDIPEPISF